MTPFHASSYLSQVRRLRRLAELAVTRWALRAPVLHFINHGENTTFRVTDRDGRKYLLRVHRDGYHTHDAILEELSWLEDLGAAEFCVPAPLRSNNGRFIEHVTSAGVAQPRRCSLLHWVEGSFYHRGLRPKHLYALGALIARLHRHASNRPTTRRYWDATGLVGDTPKFGNIDAIDGLTPEKQQVVTQARKRVLAELQAFEQTFPDRLSLIHADLHFGNVVYGGSVPGAIDFDDCGFGFQAYDLAVPLGWLTRLCEQRPSPSFRSYADALQEGYASVHRWDEADRAIVPTLITARGLSMVGWLQSRKDNPMLQQHLAIAAERLVTSIQEGRVSRLFADAR